ncbi:MAG TPA: hypothetical protein VGJ05_07250 [Fimbriiglobus sp.]|jgi:hypothetical protein
MNYHLPPPDDLLTRAAQCRVAGDNWKEVDRNLREPYAPSADERTRDWMRADGPRWRKALRDAQLTHVTEAMGEAVLAQRHLLRHKACRVGQARLCGRRPTGR